MPEGVAVNVRGRSYKIIADVDLTADAHGVIFAHGSRFGGHALFIKDRKLYYVYNFLGIKPEQKFVSRGTDARQARAGHGVHPRGRRASTANRSAPRRCTSTTRSWPKGRCARRWASSRSAATACASATTAPTTSAAIHEPGHLHRRHDPRCRGRRQRRGLPRPRARSSARLRARLTWRVAHRNRGRDLWRMPWAQLPRWADLRDG